MTAPFSFAQLDEKSATVTTVTVSDDIVRLRVNNRDGFMQLNLSKEAARDLGLALYTAGYVAPAIGAKP